ncbi:MAG TPA: class I SAM-dependent methyltransferase [Micromonosporaceae bacterium]|nr:class I SAM-dependent methyltransferase [Micromonosporaceae bacterium]
MRVADTNQHYDLDPAIFGSFLDPLRKYSCGLYQAHDDTLETAQLRKLRFVADRLGLRGGERVLDVGCGWGSLVLFLARELGCSVVGVSPAPHQVAYVTGRAAQLGLAGRVQVQQGHFETVDLGRGGFDAVTMLGSIVHMPDLAGAYRKARVLVRRGGMLYVSESCFRNAALRERFSGESADIFVRDGIFGWGDMRPLSELVRAAEEAGLSMVSLDDLTDHYRRTISDWLANVRSHQETIDGTYPGMAARLVRYLETANAGWGYTTKHYALVCRAAR